MNRDTFSSKNSSLSCTTSRRQALKIMGGGLLGGVAMATGMKAVIAQTPTVPANFIPIEGTLQGADFAGFVEVVDFFVENGQLLTNLNVFAADAAGGVGALVGELVGTVLRQASTASCEILDLVIEPINLDLLGLVISTDTIHLNITAEQGPGNLLGNLLCALTGLLDSPGLGGGLLNRIANILNQILGSLGGA